MQFSQQFDRETHRAVVLGANGTELLVVANDRGFLLPGVDIPRDQRLAESLTTAMRKEWGCETVCLFAPDVPSSANGLSGTRYEVMEFCHKTHDARTEWVPVSSVSRDCFTDAADYAAVKQSVAECNSRVCGQAPGPFARIGWFKHLQAWVEEVIRPRGLQLTGPFCQFNASPTFSLISFETNGPTIWFKAAGEPNQREFPITTALARLFPKYLPIILASRPSWRAWLMDDAGAAIADEPPSLDRWGNVGVDLACLQIKSIDHTPELLAAECRDLRISALLDLVDPFLGIMHELMLHQPKVPPAVLSRSDLDEVGITLKNALQHLDSIPIPETLGHGDFNPGNILVTDESCRFIDWAEAYIGHPFFTLEYLLSYLRRDCPDIAPFEEMIRSRYSQLWKYIIPAQSIAEAFVFSPLVAVFAYAVTCDMWTDSESQNQHMARSLRSMTRRMKREADALRTRRALCLR